ncbi:UNVERIFIED_ORG: class I SAM-dependent methyltransferase [Roseateles sp. XES5]|nr:class I SAM-dependent methyltransferase [Roseateles sp. XES5]
MSDDIENQQDPENSDVAKPINGDLENRFTEVFLKKLWGAEGSVSGPGSHRGSPMWVKGVDAIDAAVTKFGVRSIADCPCGDFVSASGALELHPTLDYVGYDIVADLIEQNRKNHPDRRFEHFDIVSSVPPAYDLIFCKELLIHLTNDQIFSILANVKKSGSKYFIASNSFGVENTELEHAVDGQARAVDLTKEPYNMKNVCWNNSFFAMWRCEDLPG